MPPRAYSGCTQISRPPPSEKTKEEKDPPTRVLVYMHRHTYYYLGRLAGFFILSTLVSRVSNPTFHPCPLIIYQVV